MTTKQIQAHERKFRKGDKMGKGWRDDWDAMARKTVYRQLIGKWGVMSIEYQNAGEGFSLAQQMADEGYTDTPSKAPEYISDDENTFDADYSVVEDQTGDTLSPEAE
jgi:recombination protein RecT